MYSVAVHAGNGQKSVSSVPLAFFTGMPTGTAADWQPVWIEPCSSNRVPPNASSRNVSFAWLRGTLALPAGDEVESALAYASAEGPSMPSLNTKGYSSTYLAMGFANVLPKKRRAVFGYPPEH